MVDGSYSVVEVAICDGGRRPLMELLELLQDRMWPNPNVVTFPDEYQASQRSRLLAQLERIGAGEDLPRNSVNYLTDGIWEIVVGDLRVTFYGTDGGGKVDMKTPAPRGYWSNAEFSGDYARVIRIGHYFAKTGPKTSEADIRAAIRVRDEDLEYDRC